MRSSKLLGKNINNSPFKEENIFPEFRQKQNLNCDQTKNHDNNADENDTEVTRNLIFEENNKFTNDNFTSENKLKAAEQASFDISNAEEKTRKYENIKEESKTIIKDSGEYILNTKTEIRTFQTETILTETQKEADKLTTEENEKELQNMVKTIETEECNVAHEQPGETTRDYYEEKKRNTYYNRETE